MGGFGSGNYDQNRRPTTDQLPCIHIRDVEHDFLLPNIWLPVPTTTRTNLYLRAAANGVIFGSKAGGEVIEIGYARIAHSVRNFGGHQTYFQCQCGKKVTKLYVNGSAIACRKCHSLLYESQFNRKYEQPAAKAAKLRAKLGGGPALLQPLPDRPKAMHRETYETLTYRILAYELEAAAKLKQHREEYWLPKLLNLDELADQY